MNNFSRYAIISSSMLMGGALPFFLINTEVSDKTIETTGILWCVIVYWIFKKVGDADTRLRAWMLHTTQGVAVLMFLYAFCVSTLTRLFDILPIESWAKTTIAFFLGVVTFIVFVLTLNKEGN